MFRAASRRACASAPKTTQRRHQPLTRSICNNARLSILRSNSRLPNSQLFLYNATQVRNLSFSQRMRLGFQEASKGIWRKNPILLPLAIASVVSAGLFFAYTTYVEFTRIRPQYTKFPPPVADTLRTGVYYTEVDQNPRKALKAYQDALRIGLEMGMHPFSDEVIGIKLQVAMMFEKAGLVQPATEVLERTKVEILKWVDDWRKKKALESREAAADARKEKKGEDNVVIDDPEFLETQRQLKNFEEFETRQQDRALKKAVGIQLKLSELYSSDYIQDEKKAEAAQVAAVELVLKEIQRRQSLGLPVGGAKENSDAWLNMTEMATALAELASTYTTKDKPEFALPLYLRALDLLREDEGDFPSCKQVSLLNGVATVMAGQVQKPVPRQQQPQQPVPREQTVEAAKQWAQKAIDVAARIQPPIRDEDCDLSCVAATYNLGELAELQGKREEALKHYLEAKSLASGLEFEDGVAMADSAVKRLVKK